MTSHRRALVVVVNLALMGVTGCSGIRSLGQRLFHRHCAVCSTCATTVDDGGLVMASGEPIEIVSDAPIIGTEAAKPVVTVPPIAAPPIAAPPTSEPALPPVQHPAPPPRKVEAPRVDAPTATLAPLPTAPTLPPPAIVTTPPPPALAESRKASDPPELTLPPAPGALSLKVDANKGIAQIGDDLNCDIVLTNQGGSPIESVNLVATLSRDLRVRSVSPEGTATIEGQKVTFKPIKNFTPMPLTFRIQVDVSSASAENAVITVEATSSILSAGPLKQQVSIRLNPKAK